MLAGLPYKAWLDGLSEERMACRRKLHAFNLLPPDEEEQAQRLLRELLGKTGRDPWINAPFHCDYGWNIEVGDNFFANYNLTILDVGKVTIGSNVQFAPNVSIYTAGHPLHPDSRNSGYEYGLPVTIGDNVWIGGNVVLLPGVTAFRSGRNPEACVQRALPVYGSGGCDGRRTFVCQLCGGDF